MLFCRRYFLDLQSALCIGSVPCSSMTLHSCGISSKSNVLLISVDQEKQPQSIGFGYDADTQVAERTGLNCTSLVAMRHLVLKLT